MKMFPGPQSGRFAAALLCSVVVACAATALAQEKALPVSAIALVSSRDFPALLAPAWLASSEIYLIAADGTNARRITNNSYGEGFPAISPDGRRIVFESDRLRTASQPTNWASLFVVDVGGGKEIPLVPGNSASWSSDSKRIVFHSSAGGDGKPISGLPGAAAADSDIFVLDIADFISKRAPARNLTNNPAAVDDDPDWSPDGKNIVFTSHAAGDDPENPVSAEIYVMDASGKGKPRRLTNNNEEERAPDWSPDGKLIAYHCRKGAAQEGRTLPTFEICIMNADGTGQRRITNNNVPELTISWSPDGRQMVFHRAIGGRGFFQLLTINIDGTGEKQITFTPGFNGFPSWGKAISPAK